MSETMSETDTLVDPVDSPVSTATTTAIEKPHTDAKRRLGPKMLQLPHMPSIPNVPKVRFVPLRVPRERRLQTLTVFLWAFSVPITLFLFLLSFTNPFFWPFLVAYWLFVLFDIAPENGGRAFDWAKRLGVWKYYADYFPCTLEQSGRWNIKVQSQPDDNPPQSYAHYPHHLPSSLFHPPHQESELDPSKNYIFGYHPHGIISMGAFTNFATEATGFSDKFPGIKPRLLTLTSNFNLPLYRDYLMAMGCASVSRTSCENILNKGPGSSIVIVVGGAAESLNARPGTSDLTLRKRLGFIKLAMRNGASLVPVFSFGENDLYEQLQNEKGSNVWKWQKAIQKAMGFTLPLFHGRGMFNYDLGLLPHRRAIHTIVGHPIDLVKTANPTEEEVLAAQKLYIDELQNIYDKYKNVYAKDRKRDMTIIE
ncbi:diacylglycerol acyltransferase-domain-containing protein [Jimgerdemannia flammicorona]|uniref:Diacylglycerol O-acyltransferase n=1 Tax=Jimgerdemannia flammicorona TaxID=994334 RepID=A0A433DEX5_9FUNG|nr:diacylglycerol acyltransferase-domain-containing protein [Jimgerdemannia flammicorona]